MKKIMVVTFIALMLYACSENVDKTSQSNKEISAADEPNKETIPTPGGDPPAYDPNRGTGKFTHVDVGDKLDVAMANGGEKIYNVKCSGCHKVTDEKLVGPGGKGVRTRPKPERQRTLVTTPGEMLNKDPKAQDQLKI